MRKDLEQGRRG